MENNKEVKIAIIVAVIMLTICLIIFIFHNAQKEEVINLDLKVYKLYELGGEDKEDYEYRPCNISTEDLVSINNDFKKIFNLNEDNKEKGKQIKGNYKIVSGENFIAFDAGEENLVYRSDLPAIFKYDTTLYENVAKLCE